MGLFLMESMRITRLFPVIGALNDKLRVKMIWISLTILTILASVEAGLAFMREIMMQDAAATRAALRGGETTEIIQSSFMWITTAAQMVMGFILPFALTFVAIPLESFVHSFRTVIGVVLLGSLRALAWFLRFVGDIAKFTSTTFVHTYDLIIFLPLWIEQVVQGKHAKKKDTKPGGVNAHTAG